MPIGRTTAYQVNLAEAEAALPGAAPTPAAAAGRRLLRARRRLAQITAAQAEAEAVIAQSVENLYSLNAVAPNGTYRYEWLVPDSAAPGPGDGEVVAYAYVSGVDHIKHINAGLVGAVLVYAAGAMPKDDGKGVQELPLLFNIQNEMQSELYEFNLAREKKASGINISTTVSVHACLWVPRNTPAAPSCRASESLCSCWHTTWCVVPLRFPPALRLQAVRFPESNLMHAINGYLYCNGPTLQLAPGAKLRTILMGFGSEVDMHSPVFAGQSLSHLGELDFYLADRVLGLPAVAPAKLAIVRSRMPAPVRASFGHTTIRALPSAQDLPPTRWASCPQQRLWQTSLQAQRVLGTTTATFSTTSTPACAGAWWWGRARAGMAARGLIPCLAPLQRHTVFPA